MPRTEHVRRRISTPSLGSSLSASSPVTPAIRARACWRAASSVATAKISRGQQSCSDHRRDGTACVRL